MGTNLSEDNMTALAKGSHAYARHAHSPQAGPFQSCESWLCAKAIIGCNPSIESHSLWSCLWCACSARIDLTCMQICMWPKLLSWPKQAAFIFLHLDISGCFWNPRMQIRGGQTPIEYAQQAYSHHGSLREQPQSLGCCCHEVI